jgi:mitochondrial pyruvate carrier 1
MTGALTLYSAVFMRYAMAVQPRNYLLFGCHAVNFSAQLAQGYRYLAYNNWGGKEKAMEQRAKEGLEAAKQKGIEAKENAKDVVKDTVKKVEEKVK